MTGRVPPAMTATEMSLLQCTSFFTAYQSSPPLSSHEGRVNVHTRAAATSATTWSASGPSRRPSPRRPYTLITTHMLRLSRRLATAAVCKKLGDPLSIVHDWKTPQVARGQVKIKVAAAGVNFADILQARGQYQDKAEPPFVPGNEAAGEVCEVGEGVKTLAIGDRVICLSRGGAYASETVADARTCLKLPPSAASADLAEAAALLVNYGTAHLALTSRAHLQSGETVLVTAAAGGVGLATVELARLMGASRVIAACGSDAKLSIATTKGADAKGINYAGLDGKAFRNRLKEFSADGDRLKGGIDVVVDMVGASLMASDGASDCLRLPSKSPLIASLIRWAASFSSHASARSRGTGALS